MKPTCDLYDDFEDALFVLPTGLRHFGGKIAFDGKAMTIKTFEVNSKVKELANTPGEGRVMVVDGGASDRRALVGDMIGAEAVAHGWAGVIVWGAVRDVAQMRGLDLGIMALAATPRRCVRKGEGEIGVDLVIGDTPVRPGDYIVADEDGALVFPQGGPMPHGV